LKGPRVLSDFARRKAIWQIVPKRDYDLLVRGEGQGSRFKVQGARFKV
jgi:hypothetical protein